MQSTVSDGLSRGEEKTVISILHKWHGGPLSNELFTVLAKIIPQTCVETVILRKHTSGIQILLTRRDTNDPVWPGIIHSPGGILRYKDFQREDGNPFMGPIERVQKKEIMTDFISPPEFVGLDHFLTKRGPEIAHIYLAKIADNAVLQQNANWYNVDTLSQLDNFLIHQLVRINQVVDYFK